MPTLPLYNDYIFCLEPAHVAVAELYFTPTAQAAPKADLRSLMQQEEFRAALIGRAFHRHCRGKNNSLFPVSITMIKLPSVQQRKNSKYY